jgi:Fur family transcriptional regulator, ferric uptake regulator
MRSRRSIHPHRAIDPRAQAAQQVFEHFLAAQGLRLTQARAAIVETALQRTGHFCIEELAEDLERRGIRGSKATVYRTLPILTAAGIIHLADASAEPRTYETIFGREHHDHLMCRKCGKVVEFEYEAIEVLQRAVAARHGFELDEHHLQLIGRCGACRSSEGPERV